MTGGISERGDERGRRPRPPINAGVRRVFKPTMRARLVTANLSVFPVAGFGAWMRLLESQLRGVFIIDIERNEDERGFFARTHCDDEFAAHRLHASFVEESISYNRRQGTVG